MPNRYTHTAITLHWAIALLIFAAFPLKQNADTLIIDGMFPLKRLDYGIGSGVWSDTGTVADEVQIRFHFAVAKK